ncbi:hypothetical protein FACS1894202_09130 [Clostridia bacterium]|nr:hypothetical protein FACS1894202_09130 [Clostridia bacterium]
MSTNPRKNSEGYSDPTAFYAERTVARKENRDAGLKPEPPKVYICSPFAGDTETNVANALKYCRFAVERGKFPIAPHCYLPRFMNDDNPAERELALSFGVRLLYDCTQLWIFGTRISEGMKCEILAARWRNIRIKQFNTDMEEM